MTHQTKTPVTQFWPLRTPKLGERLACLLGGHVPGPQIVEQKVLTHGAMIQAAMGMTNDPATRISAVGFICPRCGALYFRGEWHV